MLCCYFPWNDQNLLYVLGQHDLKPHSNNEKGFSKNRGHFGIMTITHLPLLLDPAGEAE
jgi:hypothetical protein